MTMFDKVSNELDFPTEEKQILALWKERQIFQKSLELRKDCKPFVFYEGPPTANGLPHNGHVLTRVIKDLFPRYRTMRGYLVNRKAGWDTHGLPVETEVEKELRIHGKAAIERYGVEPFIQKCIDSVFRYTKEWEELTERIGFWVDTDDAYVTYHKSYVESVWWALSVLFEKGLLYQGHKVVWWWAQGGTALSAAEVGQGYKEVDDPSVYVTLAVEGTDTALLVWTTTPWTLPSNSYAAVHPDIEYVLVDAAGKKLWLAEGLREELAKKLKTELTVLESKRGADLVGLRYQPPFDLYKTQAQHYFRVIAANFVTLDSGTGIVHIAPAFGEDDFEAHKRELAKTRDEVPLLCAVQPDGTFVPEMGKYAGRWVKDADKDLIQELKARGSLVHSESYRHDYPFCVRADKDPLIQYARPAWYIRTTERIDQTIQNNQQVHWLPEHIKEGRMGDFLRNNVDWALSRERWWGTPLNVWVCDRNSDHKQAPASVAQILEKNPRAFDHFHEAKRKDPTLNEHLIVHKPWIDRVTFPCQCGGTMQRVTEVIDCWFDSGCMPFAQWGYPHTGKERFEKSFPANFISEAIDQTRGWFYSLQMVSTLVFEQAQKPHPYETCLVLGHVSDKQGKKESKSQGNYTPPGVVYDKVQMEFAVVDTSASQGQAFICPDDYAGLDLPAQARVVLRSASGKEVEVLVAGKKGMARRHLSISAADAQALGVRVTAKSDVKPGEIAGLTKEERLLLSDPNQPAPGADAFRWFFFAASPAWSNTRHSLSNVRALQREFLVRLRNTYAFFVIYANIDGFDPNARHEGTEPAELDRWILSELNELTQGVTADMDAYLAYEATQKLTAFVDALSNWYVRRSRDRFWRSGWDADKRAAYATLYDALLTLSKLIAPFVPFMAESMYQNLTRPLKSKQPESVHLADWPTSNAAAIDASLSAKMSAVRDIVSLGLQVRTSAKLKVRQPLRAAHVILARQVADVAAAATIIKDELNVLAVHFVAADRSSDYVEVQLKPNFRSLGARGLGREAQTLKKALAELGPAAAAALHQEFLAKGSVSFGGVTLEGQDLEAQFTTKPNYVAAGDRIGVVALETTLDDELRELGHLRELINRIQTLRKEMQLEFTDRIHLSVIGGEQTARVVAKHKETIAAEVLASKLETTPIAGTTAHDIEVEGETVQLYLKVA
jgi:isoleucyl-tRNA synthetase